MRHRIRPAEGLNSGRQGETTTLSPLGYELIPTSDPYYLSQWYAALSKQTRPHARALGQPKCGAGHAPIFYCFFNFQKCSNILNPKRIGGLNFFPHLKNNMKKDIKILKILTN